MLGTTGRCRSSARECDTSLNQWNTRLAEPPRKTRATRPLWRGLAFVLATNQPPPTKPNTVPSRSMKPPETRRSSDNSRRVHRKSRTGCLVCKERRVKWDEGHPRRRNCLVGNRPCSYGNQTTSTSDVHAKTHASPEPSAGRHETESTIKSLGTQGTFTALHLKLLYHASTHMAQFRSLVGDIHPIIEFAWANQATELQTRALRLFNKIREHISESIYMASFIFASLLGMHVLRDTLADDYRSAGDFVRVFVNYVRIHRGVRTMTDNYWQHILDSNLKPLLHIIE
ncbi:hypothetical protein S40293_09926 [Stachybotrys chartarum IBT 40293]|nr:hypothetical protein S40293_09926 [Stachybotrys chartarum IBT 40293]